MHERTNNQEIKAKRLLTATTILFAIIVSSPTLAQLTAEGNQFWSQADPGIIDTPEDFDEFGSAFAVGDFNGDGYQDLAIGVPSEAIESEQEAGAVHVIYGSSTGLMTFGNQFWRQGRDGLPGNFRFIDRFGQALASGDFDSDGFDDLAIGVPGENELVDGLVITAAGIVQIIFGSASGLNALGTELISQNTPGVDGFAEPLDRFGSALATGDFNNDGHSDLAVGVPFESIGSVSSAGAVQIFFGDTMGLAIAGNQLFFQGDGAILGTAEQGDSFGSALTTGRFNDDDFDDLAVGVPLEDITTISNAGVVQVINGGLAGLNGVGDQLIDQTLSGSPSSNEEGDRFGTSLASGDMDGDGFDELVVGAPGETLSSFDSAGAFFIHRGSEGGVVRGRSIHQGVVRIPGDPGVSKLFSQALTMGNFDGDGLQDLVVGIPGENMAIGATQVFYGTDDTRFIDESRIQVWSQDNPDILNFGTIGDQFGAHLAAGDFDGNGVADLAIGVPEEDFQIFSRSGAANVIYGRPRDQLFSDRFDF